MNHILHQFKKDLAHQRWALVAWLTLLLIHLLVSGFQILRHVPNPQASTEQFAGIVASWVVFAPLLFVILAVQADTPAGTAGFWLTRPLRGAKMLAAKSLYIFLLFVILPLSVEMMILLLRGAGSAVWLLLLEFSVVRLPVVLGAFALGVATSSFLQALALAAVGASVGIATMLLGSHLFSGGSGIDNRPAFSASRGIVALWSLAAVFAAVVVVQFLTRREGLSRCLFAAGIAAAMLIQLVWPFDIFNRAPRDRDALDPIEVHIDPTSISFDSFTAAPPRDLPIRKVSVPIEIGCPNLGPGRFLAPIASRVELVTPSSTSLTGFSAYGIRPVDEHHRPALESLFSPRGIKIVSPGDLGYYQQSHLLNHDFAMGDDRFARLSRDLGQVRVAVDIGEFEFRSAGEIPLRDGAKWQDRGDQLEIVKVKAMTDSLRLRVREQQLSLTFSPRNAQGRRHSYPWVLVLANRESKTAILLNRNDSPMRYRGVSWLSPFLRGDETIEISLRQALGADFNAQSAAHWLLNSTLIIVRRDYLGSLRVEGSTNTSPIRQLP